MTTDVRYGSRLCENASLDLILGIRFSRDLREDQMKRFVEGSDRGQSTLFPECVADWIGEDNTVRVIDVFVEELDLAGLGFDGVAPEATGRPSYHPSVVLKLYIYGYLNRVQSSRRLEHEAGRNVEVMWLTGRLVPDHKTIADFRKDNGGATLPKPMTSSAKAAARAVERDAAARHDHVNVGMMRECRAPGMQDGSYPDAGSQVLGVGRDGDQRLGRRLEEDIVNLRLVLIGDIADRRRQREDQVIVRHRQQVGLARGQPLLRGGALTLRAMPIAAAVVGNDRVGAAFTARDMPAEGRRAAALDCRHHLQLAEADMTGIGFTPRRSVVAENIRDLQPWTRHARRASGGRLGLFELARDAIERAHDLPDGIGGDARIERRGVELGVPQQDLDHPNVDILLQQVGGKAVAERMRRHALADLGHMGRRMAGARELARRHRADRVLSGKQPTLRVGRLVPGAQQR